MLGTSRLMRLGIPAFLCLVVASVATAAQASVHGGSSVVTFRAGHFQLNGKPFFPVMALLTFCPTPDTVGELVALDVNVIEGYALSCTPTGGTLADGEQTLHNALQGRVLWVDEAPSPNYYPQDLPELVTWTGDRAYDDRDGSRLLQCAPNAIASAYDNIAKAVTKGPVILRVSLAQDGGVQQANLSCLTAPRVGSLISTAIAAGAAGVEFVTQSRGNGNAHPDLLFDLPQGLASGLTQRMDALKPVLPAVLQGELLTPLRISPSSVKGAAWHYRNKVFVLATNTGDTSATAALTSPRIGGSSAQVLGENRPVQTHSGTMSDRFKPLVFHIYESAFKP
ncbi:MAG: hypothetical protein ACREF0_08855 [Acetobacteraceae bacterium]